MHIFKEFGFEAAHQLPQDAEGTYGNCSRVHGHSYRFRVAIQGALTDKGWVMNFQTLSDIVKRTVIDQCDHRMLNDVYPNTIVTIENLALHWGRTIQAVLQSEHPGIALHSIEAWETGKCGVVLEAADLQVSSTPSDGQ